LSLVNQAQILFLLGGLVLLMLILIEVAIAETRQNDSQEPEILLCDRIAGSVTQTLCFGQCSFTTFVALVSRTAAFTSLVATPIEAATSSPMVNVASLFTWCYIGFGAVLQVPLVQVLRSWLSVPVLTISMLL